MWALLLNLVVMPTLVWMEEVDNTVCNCDGNNSTLHLLQKANIMQEEIKNKTNVFSKFHHRATHSEEALWASLSLALILALLVIGTIKSKMWLDRPYVCYMDSQPVRYERFSRKSEILIKTLLKSKARSLVKFSRSRNVAATKPQAENNQKSLDMSKFLQPRDEIDSSCQHFLHSSSESSDDMSSASSGEDEGNTFWMNKYTGEWERASILQGSHSSLLGNTKDSPVRSQRISVTSTDSQPDIPLDSSLVKELRRVSSDSEQSESETAALIKIG
eukprot:TRINITY_DN808_c0_g1_i1.p1 TRINITY_DN808_c0_g1~~TRINITY_DN808_c0_g1_i1.p1  ORF type:complete len:274 (-),score=37.99 TRINITY_DN808_c0_g1_i1:1207-2028(-)